MADKVAPAVETTLTQKGAISLRKTAYDKSLREDVTLPDIFNKLTASVEIKNGKMDVPDNVFMQFMTAPPGTNRITIGMYTPLKKAPQVGTGSSAVGNEESMDLLHLTLRYNEIKKAVAQKGWGVEHNDINSTGLYSKIPQAMKKFMLEWRGVRIREAILLTYANELTAAPVSLTQKFNSNIFIPNLAVAQPVYDVTNMTVTTGAVDSLGYYPSKTYSGVGTYVEDLADKMMTASGTASASKAYLTVENLEDLILYLTTTVKMKPLATGGLNGFIFGVSSYTASVLLNPLQAGSMGALWKDITNLTKEEASYPGMLGKYRCLYFVVDDRAATLTVSGSAGSYSLQPGFMNPGNNDDRNHTPWSNTSGSVNYVFDVNYVLGEGALAEWIVDPETMVDEYANYKQDLGKGLYTCGGIQLAAFDKDTPDDANNSASTSAGKTQIQRGSCVVLSSRRPAATIR